MSDLERVYLVTGAASGIGRATAHLLAAPGIGLMLHTRANQVGLEAVATDARAQGAAVATCLGDFADDGLSERVIATTNETYGQLDALIAVAGAAHRGGIMDLPDADLRRIMDESVIAFANLVRAAHALLKQSSTARIVAVSSFVVHAFRTDVQPFAATRVSRAALEAVAKLMARELASDGITVNAVAPGLIQKDEGPGGKLEREAIARMEAMIPLGRRGLPEEVASMIAFLTSPAASYITGQICHVNGGFA
jgi:3-oxoacyl-[acyl-carrier protein] reductase